MAEEPSPTTSQAPADLAALSEQNQALAARVGQLENELAQLRRRTLDLSLLFSPAGVLILSLGAALAFAALVILSGRYRFYLLYMVPMGAPATAFLLDRAANWRDYRAAQWVMEVPLILLALTRAFYPVPFISGHALFLSYALLTVRSRAAQVLALLVLLETMYFKVFAWHDPTLYGGVLLGALAAWVSHRFGHKRTLSTAAQFQLH